MRFSTAASGTSFTRTQIFTGSFSFFDPERRTAASCPPARAMLPD
jgi:hypothetical protein